MSGRWGPEHQGERQQPRISPRWIAWVIIALAVYGITQDGIYAGNPSHKLVPVIAGLVILAVLALLGLPASMQRRLLKPFLGQTTGEGQRRAAAAGGQRRSGGKPTSAATPADLLKDARDVCWRAGGGPYLGLTAQGQRRYGRGERAVLILGPPRSGKTSSVIIPTLLSHTGPVVSTSTKPDVLQATRLARGRAGRVWVFDPTASNSRDRGGGLELRWSPVSSATMWDGALLTARAMTSTVGVGVTDRSHWSSRAQALLAPMLHAAAVHGLDMGAVVGWVMGHDLDEPGTLLEDERCSEIAFQTLAGVFHTEARERSSILSAAADAIQAYSSEKALQSARIPNFNPTEFVQSFDTVYIHAPAEQQAAAAPLVCGLLSEIRRATYQVHANRQLTGRVLFALDEAANIAPLEELPQIASEGAGQSLILLAALQDLSQARARWGEQADGFLTLFGTKLILPGVADTKTLEAVSTMLGEYDRQVVSHSHPQTGLAEAILGSSGPAQKPTSTYSTQRTRVLSPGEVANIPTGKALHLDGVKWELVTLTPAHAREPWRTLVTTPQP